MNEFFALIYSDLKGYATINTKSESGELDSERWLRVPEDVDNGFMARYAELRAGEDVYYSVACFTDKRRVNTDVGAMTRVVWADADTCPPTAFKFAPSVVVQTSPGRWHVLWVLDAPVPAKDAEVIARRISYAHRAQGCDTGWTMTKILRVPGTSNTKSGEPIPVSVTYTGKTYTITELGEAYPATEDNPTVTGAAKAAVPEPLAEDECLALESDLELWGLADLYVTRPSEGQSWSERAYRLELDMFRNGLDPRQVFSLMRRSPANKYNPENAGLRTQTGVVIPKRHSPDSVLWAEVSKAYAEHLSSDEIEPADRQVRATAAAEFLSSDERELVTDNPTFIDDYVRWALERSPQSAPIYHYSLAYVLLSCSLAEFGQLRLKYGRMPLNLWTLILGDTTRTHKSTAKDLFLACVHEIENLNSGSVIDIGSDATTEALLQLLGTRNDLVSLLHTDEIAGFLKENYVKNYRAGTLEAFTDLYGGNVPVTLRATRGSGNRNRARTIFDFVGVGIRKKVAEVLTREFFESGFLLRMTWCVADTPKYRAGDSDLPVEEDDPNNTFQASRTAVLGPVFRAYAGYSGRTVDITLADDAVVRLNKFANDMHVFASKNYQDEVLDSAVDRLRDSVLKGAALLSLLWQESEVSLFAVQAAIAQGERWFASLTRMLSEVSNSSFGRTCDEVEKFIAAGDNHQQTEMAIYRKFTFKPQEFSEVMTYLQKGGMARRVPSSAQRWEVLL